MGEGNRLARPQEWEERAKNISWVFSTQFWGLKTAFPGINSSDKRHSDKRVIKMIDCVSASSGSPTEGGSKTDVDGGMSYFSFQM